MAYQGRNIKMAYMHMFSVWSDADAGSTEELGAINNMITNRIDLVMEDEILIRAMWGLYAHAEQLIIGAESLTSFLSDPSDTVASLVEDDSGTYRGQDILQNLSEIQCGLYAQALMAMKPEASNPHDLEPDGENGSLNFESGISRSDFLSAADIAVLTLMLQDQEFYSMPTVSTDSTSMKDEGGDDIVILAVGIPVGMVRALEYPELDLSESSEDDVLSSTLDFISLAASATSPAEFRESARQLLEIEVTLKNMLYPTLVFDTQRFVFDPRLFLSPYTWDIGNSLISHCDGIPGAPDAASFSSFVGTMAAPFGRRRHHDLDVRTSADSVEFAGMTMLSFMPCYFANLEEGRYATTAGPYILDGPYYDVFKSAAGGHAQGIGEADGEIDSILRYENAGDGVLYNVLRNHALDDLYKKYYKFSHGLDLSEYSFPSSSDFNKTLVDENILDTLEELWENAGVVPEDSDGELTPFSGIIGEVEDGYSKVINYADYAASSDSAVISTSDFSYIRNMLSSRLYSPLSAVRNAISAKSFERTFLIPVDPSTFVVNIDETWIARGSDTADDIFEIVAEDFRVVDDLTGGDAVDSGTLPSFRIASTPTSFFTFSATVKVYTP